MKLASGLIIVFLVGAITGVIGLDVAGFTNIDLLSEAKGYYVKTNTETTWLTSDGETLILPRGTTMRFDSKYREEGQFSITLFSTQLDAFQKVPEGGDYYQKEKSK